MKEVHAKTRKQWRSWLKRNHLKEKEVLLIYSKRHTGKPAPSHLESMEEAICFGWIDTTVKKIDDDHFGRKFVRRRENAGWSTNTLSYAKRMIEEGKMEAHGLKAYNLAKNKKTIDHDLPKNPDPPEELLNQLKKSKKALNFFTNLAPSYKRYYVRWLLSAKLPETRKKRIKVIYDRCKESKKPAD